MYGEYTQLQLTFLVLHPLLIRWVIYNPKHNVDYDGSMVPAEWFGWLHYKTDKTPIEQVN